VQVRNSEGVVKNLLQSVVQLDHVGQETTVFRFQLDDKGHLVPGSLNRIHKDLRAAWSKSERK
jgi:hypothetical protein